MKSGFRQLHFSNGNIGNTRHRKAAKNYTLFKNNKMVFLYPFFPHTTIILFQVANKLEKRNGEMLDARARQNSSKFVTFYQKKFIYSSKEAYYYGEKCSVLANIFTFAHLEYFKKNLFFAPFL